MQHFGQIAEIPQSVPSCTDSHQRRSPQMLPNAAFWANCRNSSKCSFLHWLTPIKKPSDVTKCSILGKLQEFLKVCLPALTHTKKEALRCYQMQHFGQIAGIPQSVPPCTDSHQQRSPQTLPNAAFWAICRNSSECAFVHCLTPRRKPSDVTKCSILGNGET